MAPEGPPLKRQKLEKEETLDLLPSEDDALWLEDLEKPEGQADAEKLETDTKDYDAVYDQSFYQPTGFGEMGIYLRNKRKKLAVQREQFLANDTEERPPVFEGVAVYINGATRTPLGKLSALLTIYGGEYVPYLDKKGLITHIVASELTPSKRKEFASYKVVTEDWLLDSVEAGKLLDWRKYKTYGATQALGMPAGDATGGMPSTQMSIMGHISPSKAKRPAPPQRTSTPPPKVEEVEEKPPTPRTSPSKREQGPSSEWPSYLPQAKNARRSALLDDEEWRLKNTAVAGMDYIEGYYKTSRLHHLSTWKAALPAMVERLRGELKAEGKTPRAKAAAVKPAKPFKGTPDDKRIIFHVDFDSFFVACGLASRPHLRGKPVAVCHATGNADAASSTSEIASCSYEARQCGVKNGISLGRARELCPDIQAMPYEFDLYARNSESMYKILLMHGDQIEAVSVDEGYIDVSTRVSTAEAALKLAEEIRTEIREATNCEVSIGISYNVVLARLATKRAKPASAYFLRESEALDFLAPLAVDEVPGVGWSMRSKLEDNLKVHTLGDALRIGKARLCDTMGPKKGEDIYNFARGIDTRTLKPPTERKTVSAEINYGIRFHTEAEVEDFMRNLSKWLARVLDQVGVRGKHLTLKVMRRARTAAVETPKFLGHGHCDTVNNSAELGMPTADPDFIGDRAVKLMQGLNVPPRELRGIGLSMTQLDNGLSNSQQRLSFGATKPAVVVEAPKPAVEAAPPQPVALASEPSLILIEPPVEAKPVIHPTRSRSATPQPIFAVSKQGQLGLARVKMPGKKGGKPVQSKLSDGMKLKDPRRWATVPDDPSRAELQAMGIDPGFWASLPRQLKMDAWMGAWQQLEAMGGLRYTVDQPKSRALAPGASQINPLKPVFAPGPKFGKLHDLEEIRDRLEAWVENVGIDDSPVERDVKRLRDFLVAKADMNAPQRPDLPFVYDILSFWKVLVRGGHEEWQSAVDSCCLAVNEVSGEAPLKL